MRVIVAGNGKVGFTLAERLAGENHSITVIDADETALRRAEESLDVMCVRGGATSLSTLRQAGVERADVVISVTANDEINMLCCITAKKLGARHTVARIRDPEYANDARQLMRRLDINLVVNPEQSTASEILSLLLFPSAIEIDTFMKGKAELVSFKAQQSDAVVGVPLANLRKRLGASVLVCIVERGEDVILPRGDFVINPGDKVYLAGDSAGVTRFFRSIERLAGAVRDVIVIGGGRISYYLALDALRAGIKPKIIELDPERCRRLAEASPETTVICGDGTDQTLLDSENIDSAGALAALTGRDEENLMISLYAMRRGVPKVIAKSNRSSYVSLVKDMGLDSVLSPKEITADRIMHFIRGIDNKRGGSAETLYSLLGGRAEALEFVVKRDARHIGKSIKSLPLKSDLQIALISRGGKSIVPEGGDSFAEGDSVIIVTRHLGFTCLNDIFRD
ncbi:MAG: Trk system potassium transporter TrkA [Oscillospiraceae bacterium]|jgi:trk system potassium uptake protein TrkA|nr:Trk system potassium transporter TrkA [Oscillospiraceae bacterium]